MARTDSGIFIQSSQKEITLLRRQNDGKGVTIWEEGCEHAVTSLAFIKKKKEILESIRRHWRSTYCRFLKNVTAARGYYIRTMVVFRMLKLQNNE